MCDCVLNKPQIKGETKLPSATPTASNGAEGISDIGGQSREVKMGGSHESAWAANEFQMNSFRFHGSMIHVSANTLLKTLSRR